MDSDDPICSLGLTTHQARAYRALVRLGQGTAYQVAKAASLPAANTYEALRRLAALGGAAPLPGRPRRYRPAPPEAWLTGLADALQRQASAAAEELAAQAGTERLEEAGAEARGPAAGALLRDGLEQAQHEIVVDSPVARLARRWERLREASQRGVQVAVLARGGELPRPVPAGWLAFAAHEAEHPPYDSLWIFDRQRALRYAGNGRSARARLIVDTPYALALTQGILAHIGWLADLSAAKASASPISRRARRLLSDGPGL